jgi:aldose 1-epimerase
MTLLALRAGPLAVDLAPQSGGSIARFRFGDTVDLLRPMTPAAIASGRGNDAACYPLVPFSNRIANGHLTFNGEAIRLEPNWPGVRHPMHGEGWARPWQVAAHDGRTAEIVHAHDGSTGWPFRYRAHQSFRLDEDGLKVRMSIENLERRTVPAGLGLHPFFVRDADTELQFRAAAVWLGDEEVLPTERIAVPAVWDYTAARTVEAGLDNCFDGWDGCAVITWPGSRLRLELQASTPFRHAVVYTPANQPFFSFEPVSHANGKIAESLLAPGATLGGDIAFRLSAL